MSQSRLYAPGFIEPMECLPVTKLPDGPAWTYEIKLDGYRLEMVTCAPIFRTVILQLIQQPPRAWESGKRSDGVYEPGRRSGLWVKHRINLGQEFVIGGYVDALVVGFYRGRDLIYAARVRAGLVPATRRAVLEKIKHLKTLKCPFVNLPELEAGRWGQGLTAEKMRECVWLKPEAVARIEFLEWAGADHLRHTKFAGLRDDKDPRKVIKET